MFYSFSAEIDFRRQNLTSKVYRHAPRVNPSPIKMDYSRFKSVLLSEQILGL